MKIESTDIVIDSFPQPLHCVGNAGLLDSRTVALLCSIKCPGSAILRAYDLMRDIRNENVTVISGFHSPMEDECLKILLRGTCGIVICYARSLLTRVPADLLKPISEGRLLLMSAFDDGHDHITRKSSAERNRLVADMGDILFVPYASQGGMVEEICREAAASGRPVFTFDGDHGASLRAVGAKSIPLSGAAVLLQSVPNGGDKSTQQSADSSTRQRAYSVASIRLCHPQAYAKWTDQEEALLLRLRGEGKTRREIAQALQRQPSAISSRLRKIERRTDEWPDKTTPE